MFGQAKDVGSRGKLLLSVFGQAKDVGSRGKLLLRYSFTSLPELDIGFVLTLSMPYGLITLMLKVL